MKRNLILFSSLLWLAGCSFRSEEQVLRQELLAYLNAAAQAQQQAAEQWDRLIFGESVNCQQGLSIPQPFDLSQEQADRFPDALAVRDHLNEAVLLLTTSSQIWDQLCANPDASVTPAQANKGYQAVRAAKTELDLATALWNSWNS